MKSTIQKCYWVCALACIIGMALPVLVLASGRCIEGNCIDGKGTYEESCGSQYIGQFKNGAYSGKGAIKYCDGNSYKGDFLNGYRHGLGELEWNGEKYSGGFAYDKYSGEGTLIHANANIYKGQFKAGYYSGLGTLYYADGNKYEGEFLNGYRHGYGEIEWDGDKYTGEFRHDKYSGRGELVQADGHTYTGEFENGFRHGNGKIVSESGRYEGQWKKGMWHGIGAYTYVDGKTFTGYFSNGSKTDRGTFTWGQDDERIQKWKMSEKDRDQICEYGQVLLKDAKYDEIEHLAERYRQSKELLPDGGWKLTTLYAAFDNVSRKAPEAVWKAQLDMLETWVKQRPTSITAHLALADYYVSYAFRGRGYDWGAQVTDEGRARFRDRLNKAAEVLTRADQLAVKCPHWWAVSMSIAKATGADRSAFEALVNNVFACEPLYFDFYYRAASYLLPRWHGHVGEWEHFANAVADTVGGQVGDFLYAKIVIAMNCTAPNDRVLYESRQIIWPRVKRGLEATSKIEAAVKTIKEVKNRKRILNSKIIRLLLTAVRLLL